jgi:lysophospholipase
MRRSSSTAACLLLLAACSGPEKQPPVDLAYLPGPAANAFSAEADLEARMTSELEPLYASGEDGTFTGVAGVTIHYHVQPAQNEKGAIVLVPGRTEAIQKYTEIIGDLVGQGYSVYGIDHRGQGASTRMLSDHDKGYVEYFTDYVDDLDSFIQNVVKRDAHPHLFALATSMGGAVTALHASMHPATFDAIALGSPMFAIDTGGIPTSAAETLGLTACSYGDGTGYAPGASDYKEEASVAESDVTHSETRWSLKQKLYREHPEIRLGGVTYRWLCEAFTASSYAQGIGEDNPQPTLILQAGADSVVRADGQEAYCEGAPRCQIQPFAGAFHEILQEHDATRNAAMSDVVRWFDHFGGAQ